MSQEGKAHGASDGFPSEEGEKARPELPCSHALTHHIVNRRTLRRWPLLSVFGTPTKYRCP